MRRCLDRLEYFLGIFTSAAAILVVPLALLLSAQWPLRDWIHAYSREANDLAQIFFALYVSTGITYATRHSMHLTPDVLARRYPVWLRLWLSRYVSVCITIPWALFMLYAAAPMIWRSVSQLESFPDTFNPGYFVLKICVGLLIVLVLLQALVDVFRAVLPAAEQAN